MSLLMWVHLENFQSHADSYIPLSPGLTVFVGTSDAGKSAVLRAIRWVVYNKPRGDGFIREGSSWCRVRVGLSDGCIVERYKGKDRNAYQLTQADGAVTVFEAVRDDVPLEIANVLGLEEINLQHQLDLPFLVLDSPGAIAQALNEATKLEQAGELMSWLNKYRLTSRNNAKHASDEAERFTGMLAGLEFLDQMEPVLKRHTALVQQAGAVGSRRDALLGILSRLRVVEGRLAAVTPPDGLAALVQSLRVNLIFWNDRQARQSGCRELIRLLRRVDGQLVTVTPPSGLRELVLSQRRLTQTWLDKLNRYTSLGQVTGQARRVDGMLRKRQMVAETFRPRLVPLNQIPSQAIRYSHLASQLSRLVAVESLLTDQEGRLTDLRGQRLKAMALLSNCPFCGEVLSEDGRQRLLTKCAGERV